MRGLRWLNLFFLLGVVCLSTGCQVLHELRPERLKRLNHGVDGMPASDYQTLHRSSRLQQAAAFASISDLIGEESK